MSARRRCALAILSAVALGGLPGLWAQGDQTGALVGKLTDLLSHPLAGAEVVLRCGDRGAEFRTKTRADGSYRFQNMAPGEYVLTAHRAGLGEATVSGILVAGGHEARIQTAVELSLVPEPQVLRQASLEKPPARGQAGAVAGDSGLSGAGSRVLAGAKAAGPTAAETVLAAMPASVDGVVVVPDLSGRAQMAVRAVAIRPLGAAAGAALALMGSSAAWARSSEVEPHALVKAAVEESGRPATSDAILTGEEIGALPSQGRDWTLFALNGVHADRSGETSEQEAAAGGSKSGPVMELDGVRLRSSFGDGRGAEQVQASVAGAGRMAIAEVRSDGAGDGAGGWGTGEAVRVSTKSAESGLHGQAAVFERQNAWGAQNPFSQWIRLNPAVNAGTVPTFTATPYTPQDQALTWEMSVGSAIKRRRVAWFAAVEGRDRNDPGVATVKHPANFFAQPSNDEMQVLSARLRLSSADPVSEGLAAYSGMLSNLAGLLGPAARSSREMSGFGRLDLKTAERHVFALEASVADQDFPGGGLSRVNEPFGSHSFGSTRGREALITAKWGVFLTQNLLLETQGDFVGRAQVENPAKPSAFEQSLNANIWGQLPQMVVDSRYGFTIGNPARFPHGTYPDEAQYGAHEQLGWVSGRVLINAGMNFEHDSDATSLLPNRYGTYNYANVENFVSDALSFAKYGLAGALDPLQQHNCDARGKAWRDSTGQLHGMGYLPCYSYYSQTLGPTDWHVSSNAWAGYGTAQWQPAKSLVATAALRVEGEQLPPPIGLLNNPGLPLTERVPGLGAEWGPRLSLAWGAHDSHWPVLKAGYGMYFGRTENSVSEAVLTRTGSLKGDLDFFFRPTDNLAAGGAPPFPYVLAGDPGSAVKPGAVEFSPAYRNAEVHQAQVTVEEELPAGTRLSVSGVVSLGRRLPVVLDQNLSPLTAANTITYGIIDASGKGPLKGPSITVPFYASWPANQAGPGEAGRVDSSYQAISEITSRANSTYEGATVRLWRTARNGFIVNGHYTYSHAMDWNPDESARVYGSSVLDPANLRLEYGAGDMDARHAGAAMVEWKAPWKLADWRGWLVNGLRISGAGHFQTGLPFTMRTAGSVAKEFLPSGAMVVGVGPGMNGSGGDNRVYGVGRNTYRYPLAWKADLRLAKRFDLGGWRAVDAYIDTFNLFNHQNVTRLETVGYSMTPGGSDGSAPTLSFLTGLKAGQTEFGTPLDVNATNFYKPRQFDAGVRFRF